MFWTKFGESSRMLVYSAVVVAVAAVILIVAIDRSSPIVNAAPTASFPGIGTGAIPDGVVNAVCHTTTGPPLDVTFNVTGITGSVTSVALSMSGSHTWIGDLSVLLIAPNNTSHVIFARTGATIASGNVPESWGQGDNLEGGTYSFADSNTSPPSGGWWQEAGSSPDDAHVMTPGGYRTTASGGAGATFPAPATNMNAAFAGIANANGTWTLRVVDGCNGDTGSVSAATLTVVGGGTFAADANVDMNGDGKTDYVVVRATNSPFAPETSLAAPTIQPQDPGFKPKYPSRRFRGFNSTNAVATPLFWYTSLNGSGATAVTQFSDTDLQDITPEDFDGDGKDDLAVWISGPPFSAKFQILQSTTNTIRTEIFGQDFDVASVVGDYDGDNKADPAVFRCPESSSGQCYFFFRGSKNNPAGNITYVPWGYGQDGDFFPLIGDFDGDGKYDFCLQREPSFGSNQGQFVLLRSSDLGVEYINWGFYTDNIVPGDYDGDGRADFCVSRTNDPVAGARTYYVLTRAGTWGQVRWGVNGDVLVPGDYDGDGKTDFAIWRPNTDPSQNFFWIINSRDLSISSFEWGVFDDTPIASWAVF